MTVLKFDIWQSAACRLDREERGSTSDAAGGRAELLYEAELVPEAVFDFSCCKQEWEVDTVCDITNVSTVSFRLFGT